MKIKFLLISLLTLLSAGCSSVKPALTFYQLSPPPITQQVELTSATLIIEPVTLVDYLKRPNLLLERQSGQLYVTKYQLWAEPLDQAIARTLVNHLNQSQQDFRAQSHLVTRCLKRCFRLKLFVEQFYPTERGTAVFTGKYQLFQQDKLVSQQDFNWQQDQANDGYGAAVNSLYKLTVKLASQIQQQVQQRL
ncbi:MAG: membrane integrity-associated transporter subunit PqiC [Gammaproteobacteria bacterium]|nr:membrane integrity-associated transporter subunit PqiC [Gammaproteobacteria bacterium]